MLRLVVSLLFIIQLINGLKYQQHSDEFTKNWFQNKNNNNYFYHPETFGLLLNIDPCQTMTDDEFLKFVQENVNCSGQWCNNGKFECVNKTKNCYQVDHIYTMHEIGFGCENYNCQNYVANLVLSWKAWNNNFQKERTLENYDLFFEKEIVYGELIIEDRKSEKYPNYVSSIYNEVNNELYHCMGRKPILYMSELEFEDALWRYDYRENQCNHFHCNN